MIHIVIGTKAQLIKMAPIMAELENRKVKYNFIFTGQHQETMADIRENFSVKNPDVVLHRGSDVTSIVSMFFWILKILFLTLFRAKKIFPEKTSTKDIVVVHGDTFSTLLGALMGFVSRKKVAHIESGLRSFDIFHPFPEELTRLAVFFLADLFYCPGEEPQRNLKNFKGKKINTQANTLLDSLKLAMESNALLDVGVPNSKYCVITTHRFENIFNKDRFLKNLELIEQISLKIKAIFILHPVTQKKLEEYNLLSRLQSNPNIECRPRYDYFRFMKLVFHSEFLVTDGGSNQEECFYMGKPCLLLRKATERSEGLNSTTVLSLYEKEVVAKFVAEYSSKKGNWFSVNQSPSSLIVSDLLASL